MPVDIPHSEPKVAVACRALLGEGPIWHAAEARVFWLDIKAPRIWSWRPADGETRQWTPPWRIGALAPRAVGGFVAATEHGFAFLDPSKDQYQLIGNPEAALPGNRFNDGKVAPDGAFWAGSMDDAEQQASGTLYRLDRDRSWQRLDSGYRVTNGPAFSPDGKLAYHSDSALRRVYRFPLSAGRIAGERELFLSFGEADGYPDGMTVDADGCVWIAFWDGGCVRRFSPDGEALHRIDLPVVRPTSCTFGGSDMDWLFITSARIGLDHAALEQQPLAGSLFRVRPGWRGLPSTVFAG